MEESLKKLVYAGVGFAAQASEKFEKSINDLVKKGKIEEKEGKKIVDEFFSKSEKTKDSFESKFKKTTEEIVAKFKLAPQSEIKSLNKRIEKLEKMLVKPVAKKTTRNTAAKKAVKKTTATVKKAVSPVTA
ncbi:MAG: polyhydroxyalkanoate synthesis regulator phasin [Chitinophagales bacterium]|jgi:polyhydroxyalkanoate synthesis regulator phasin